MGHEVFISYCSEDREKADAVCHALEHARIKCWMFPRDQEAGKDYAEGILDAISASQIMVVVFSAHCNVSEDVKNEVQAALSERKVIIPFRIEDVQPAGALKYHLSRRHWLDAFTPTLEKHLETLSEQVLRNLPPREGKPDAVVSESEAPPDATVSAPEPQPEPPVAQAERPSEPAVAESQVEQEPAPSAPAPQPEPAVSTPELQVLPLLEKPLRPSSVASPESIGRAFVAFIAITLVLVLLPLYVFTHPPVGQALIQAVSDGDLQRVQNLLVKGANVDSRNQSGGYTPLYLAACEGNPEIVKLLIAKGADVNAKGQDGDTPLMGASARGHQEVAELLLAKGADVNAKLYDDRTALIDTALSDRPEFVKLLLENGADVNAKDTDGVTALHLAAGSDHLQIAKLLLEKGADVDAKDKEGKTALDWATEENSTQVVELLEKWPERQRIERLLGFLDPDDGSSRQAFERMFKDPEAVKWYRQAAEQGDPFGQMMLGLMYDGLGPERDDKAAIRWMRKAAEQGYAHGQTLLARILEDKGGAGPEASREAAGWLRKAAEQGVPFAQFLLGSAYSSSGSGVPKDDKEAEKWFRKAADQGHQAAKRELEKLSGPTKR